MGRKVKNKERNWDGNLRRNIEVKDEEGSG
jgi:hypothetical protein